MSSDKKRRMVLRGLFTKKANLLDDLLAVPGDDRDWQQIDIEWELIQEKFTDLSVVEGNVFESLVEEATETELIKEIEDFDYYRKRFAELKRKCLVTGPGSVASASITPSPRGKRKFKLPVVELKKFNGDLKQWLPFWSQFRKIHDDPDIDLDDKIGYLTQATVPGSKARQIVESFPAVADNYSKIIGSLQSRFGREDLQIEVYVRELLKLVLNKTSNSQSNISILYDNIESQLRSLETFGITSEKYAAILYPLIESCLPEDMIRLWHRSSEFLRPLHEDSYETSEDFSLEIRLRSLMKFLQNEVEHEQKVSLATEGFGVNISSASVVNHERREEEKKYYKVRKIASADPKSATAAGLINCEVAKCIFCNGQHDNANCFKAQNLSLERKRNLLSEKNACFKCLRIGHNARRCKIRLRCVICGKSHVILVCPELPSHKSSSDREEKVKDTDSVLANLTNTHVFLQTLRIPVEGVNGTRTVRALIDTGSQRSYILQNTARTLGLDAKRTEKIVHALFGGSNTSEQAHQVYEISVGDGIHSCLFDALDQPVICNDISPIFKGPWLDELKCLNISLSDVGDPAPIELLLGADVIGKLYTGQKYQLQCGLVAVETTLGWTLMGQVPFSSSEVNTSMLVFSLFVNDHTISNLWDLDVIGITDPVEKVTKQEIMEETRAFFDQTTRLDDNNRYEVRLPWLANHPPISNNYAVAKQRLGRTIAKLQASKMYESYNIIFQEWLSEDIIEVVPESDNNKVVYYLPHRPVIKDSSETTKIRPVFDASSHEKNCPSLNQCLEIGPNMIELIPDVLLRFRQQRVGVVSDIRKAFLQISIASVDRDFLRFLWIGKEGQTIIYRHKRVVFGVSSSPFLLGATIDFHLKKAKGKCCHQDSLDVIEKLSNSFYVDNCITSVPDQVTLRKFVSEATQLMENAQMDLRGWESSGNSRITIPVLGLLWDTEKDCLSINTESLNVITKIKNEVVTKRLILSLAQRLFDVIGFTSPVSLIPKLMLQGLWEKRQGWDVPVTDDIAKVFCKWVEELQELSKISIQRWIQAGPNEAECWSLHTFSDASKKAYAAAVFLRVEISSAVNVYLIAARARVAPLKRVSIPRLELLAATIAARLYSSIRKEFPQNLTSYFWSDSTTVLSWIRRTEEWSVFVTNRVREIRQLTIADQWFHVPGAQNPADLPSRGCSSKQLVESKWWEGPKWLLDIDTWPQQNVQFNEEEVSKERRKRVVCTLLNNTSDNWRFYYFSKYEKLVRMMAWIFRFAHNARCFRTKLARRRGELTTEEVEEAEIFVLRVVQSESFDVNSKHISSLHPVLDKFGLIRIKTRIAERPDDMNFRMPVVLPGNHNVVRKIIYDFHRRSCHVGIQGLLSLLREKYWILGGRRVVRSVLSQCTVCKRQNSKPLVVSTPPLPLDRVRDAKVFEVTGVDLAGPLFLKNGEKAWVCLFTCAVYRAVHLELITSLATNSFVQGFRRFIARRGRPSVVYSDNGTNFVGLENSLRQLDWKLVADFSTVQRIKWRFNPPGAPWWGGFWERLIGVMKRLLRKTLGRASLNYEDLLTVLCECENIINSRPLTYVSNEPEEFAALTPAMFLQDQPESGTADLDVLEKSSLCRKLRHRQQLRDHLQKRFRNEYLAQLSFHCKRKSSSPISMGDVVLIGSDNSKRIDWPLGRVVELLPGKDGETRVVRLQTGSGQLLRPLQRLYPLESVRSVAVPEVEPTESAEEDSAGVIPSRVPVVSDVSGVPTRATRRDRLVEPIESAEEDSAVVIQSRVPDVSEISGVPTQATRRGRLVKLPARFK